MCWMCINEGSSYDDRDSYYFGYNDSFRRRRSGPSKPSAAALSRQEKAVAKFKTVSKRHATACKKKSACILLLSPADDYHLTSQCFKNFQKKVKEIPGWDAKRSKATAAEIARFKVVKKGTRYWTFLIYKSGDERVCDCGFSEEIPAALPKAIKSMKPVEKQPEAKGIRNKHENDLSQPLLQSFRKVGVKEYCACGKRKRDTDSGASSSANPVNATVGSSTSSKKESSTSAKKQKVSLDKKKFKCDNICSAAFKHCHEYLWVQKEKDLGYGNIVEILTL